MNIPFHPSERASDALFAGREKEVAILTENILSGKNTIILSYLKEGKSSLFARAVSLSSDRDVNLKVCRISSADITSEADFCRVLVQQILFSLSAGVEESMGFLNRCFPSSDPRIVVGNDGALRLETDFSRCTQAQLFRAFDIVASYVEEKGVKLCLVVEDIQQILQFNDPFEFYRHFSSSVRKSRNMFYCLFGSSVFRMHEFLKEASRSFKLHDSVITLQQLKVSDFSTQLSDIFAASGKYLDPDNSTYLAGLAAAHPYYVNLLARQAWLMTSVVCTREIISQAFESLLDVMSLSFQKYLQTMTEQQICYLRAIISGETSVSSAAVLNRFGITSATSASRSKASLLACDFIHYSDGRIRVTDPLMEKWLNRRFSIGR